MSALRPIVQLRAMVCLAIVAAPAFAADPPAGLPAWPDQAPSVYSQPLASTPLASADVEVAKPVAPAAEPVMPAAFVAPHAAGLVSPAPVTAAPQGEKHRRLAPKRPAAKQSAAGFAADSLPSFGLNFDSVYTTGVALAVVLGVFFLCAALVRRGAKKANARLPEEVVSVLGRVPLAARQFAELVRVGNKLILVSITPHGAEPLTEITDPAEIDRLVGLCRAGSKGSSTEEFDQIFRKLADESAPVGFLGDEAPQIESRFAAPADVFSAYRGARSA